MPNTLALVAASRGGDAVATASLHQSVYDELRRLAHVARRGSGPATLNTTAIVHEAYLRMAGADASYQDRSHFLGVASKAMRCVVVDHVRRQSAGKRGGRARPVTLRETLVGNPSEARTLDVLALDTALERFAGIDARGAQVVEMWFFGGLTHAEIAEALGVSVPTVERTWRSARAWLYRALSEDGLSEDGLSEDG